MSDTNDNQHYPGPASVTPWRWSAHQTVYAVEVCACGQQSRYVEIEVEMSNGKNAAATNINAV